MIVRRIAVIARLPMLGSFSHRGLDVILPLFLFGFFLDSEWIVKVMHLLWVVCFRLVRVEAVTYRFLCAFCRIRATVLMRK